MPASTLRHRRRRDGGARRGRSRGGCRSLSGRPGGAPMCWRTSVWAARCRTTRPTAACLAAQIGERRSDVARSPPADGLCRPSTGRIALTPASPIEEMIGGAFQQVAASGRRVRECLENAVSGRRSDQAAVDIAGPDLFVSPQPQYSMLWRAPEGELFPLCRPTASPDRLVAPRPGRADWQVPSWARRRRPTRGRPTAT